MYLHISKFSYCIIFQVDYSKYVAVNMATAHPHYDSAGNILNMGTSIVDKGRTKYLLFKIPSSVPGKIWLLAVFLRNLSTFSFLLRLRSENTRFYKCYFTFSYFCSETEKKKSSFKHTEVVCSIPSRSLLQPSYYHSFGMTENYIVFIEQPFKLDIVKLATAYIRGVNWASCLAFHKEDKVFYLMLSNGVGQASNLLLLLLLCFLSSSLISVITLSLKALTVMLHFFQTNVVFLKYYLPSPEISEILMLKWQFGIVKMCARRENKTALTSQACTAAPAPYEMLYSVDEICSRSVSSD